MGGWAEVEWRRSRKCDGTGLKGAADRRSWRGRQESNDC